MGYKVAVAGVTGAVGREMLAVLERRNFPVDALLPLASHRSAGKQVTFKGEAITVQELTEDSFAGCDLALFSAGGSISKKFAPACTGAGCLMVDNSSAFRMDPEVPLVVPEVNPEDAKRPPKGIIANPNCTTIIMLTAVAPLHRMVPVKRIHSATYQAASGAGQAAMDELVAGTRAALAGEPFEPKVFPYPYAFNFFAHNSAFDGSYCEEETKMVNETRKMLHDNSIAIHATCVRVPVLRTHGEAVNVTFTGDFSVERAYEILRSAPGITVFGDAKANRWAMPQDVAGQDDVFVGRIRKDLSQPNTLDLWIVGDQLLKGAALNAVQVAEIALGR